MAEIIRRDGTRAFDGTPVRIDWAESSDRFSRDLGPVQASERPAEHREVPRGVRVRAPGVQLSRSGSLRLMSCHRGW